MELCVHVPRKHSSLILIKTLVLVHLHLHSLLTAVYTMIHRLYIVTKIYVKCSVLPLSLSQKVVC